MIQSHPESDMRLNLMVLGADIINIMQSKSKKDNYTLVENILVDFLKLDKNRTPDLFIYALLFLYTVGLIDYNGYKIKLTPQLEPQPNLFS
jgi:hypothetical protein